MAVWPEIISYITVSH